jgi:ParB family chromosome partitioning protein
MALQKKTVLGRGLSALLPKGPALEVALQETIAQRDTGENGIVASITIGSIRPNPFQPRTDFDPAALTELTQSIQEKGIIQPITVRRIADGYQLISGERRLRAAQQARLSQIPAYILQIDSDEEMLELALIENIQRDNLNAMEVAVAYQRLMDECRLEPGDIAQRVGKDRSTVANFTRLLKLPEKIQEGIRKGNISMGHARALINLPSERTQLKVFEKILANDLSVRKVEELVRSAHGSKKASTGSSSTAPRSSEGIQEMEERLQRTLGTKVVVKNKGQGRGEIVIEFYSLDDFDRLMDIFHSASR